jgi:hypothetical protein
MIDPSTALATMIGPIPGFAPHGAPGPSITFSSLTGTAYANVAEALYTIDLRNGASQFVGNMDTFGSNFIAIAAGNAQVIPEPRSVISILVATGTFLLMRGRARPLPTAPGFRSDVAISVDTLTVDKVRDRHPEMPIRAVRILKQRIRTFADE